MGPIRFNCHPGKRRPVTARRLLSNRLRRMASRALTVSISISGAQSVARVSVLAGGSPLNRPVVVEPIEG